MRTDIEWSLVTLLLASGSLRSGVALAPEILYFSPLSIVTKQIQISCVQPE